jgi:hypothetical protein
MLGAIRSLLLFQKKPHGLIKSLLLICVLLAPGAAFAASGVLKTVEVTGSAPVNGERAAMARDVAVADALRKALEEYVGTVVSSETVVENYRVLSDKVFINTDGYIKGYTVIGEGRVGDLFQVTVRATVAVGEIRDNLDVMGVPYAGAGYPRVLFMIAEQNIGEKQHRFSWWSGGEFKGESFEMSVVESYLKEAFLARNFNVVDISGSTGNIEVSNIFRVADLTLERVRRIGGDLNAEVVVKGKAIVRAGPRTEGSQVGSYLADVTVEAIRIDTGTVLAAAFAHSSARHISEITGGTEALRSASAELADQLMDQLLAKWSAVQKIEVTLGGAVDMKTALDFKEAIERQVRSVSAIYQRRLSGGEAVFEIESMEPASKIAAELMKLHGWSLKVVKATPKRIELYIVETSN